MYVRRFAQDTVGTTFGASWVYVFNKVHSKIVALYKPIDYDEPLGAYAELLYSHIANLCFSNLTIRIPKIELVTDGKDLGILSYSVLDNITEDLIHMDSLMFYKYTSAEQSEFFTLGICDILECIKHEVYENRNFVELEKAVVFVLLLDAFMNNADRHGKNWGLVRNKSTNSYELAIFDNVKSFINLFINRPGYKDKDLWSIVFNGATSSFNIADGNNLCIFIKEIYPEYFEEFLQIFDSALSTFLSDIRQIRQVDYSRISRMLKAKVRYFKSRLQEE
jgi:hypothetical protein